MTRATPPPPLETFAFPEGLTPADTAHQRVETLPDGAIISASIYEQNLALAHTNKAQLAINNVLKGFPNTKAFEAGLARMSGAISKSEAYEPPASEPTLP